MRNAVSMKCFTYSFEIAFQTATELEKGFSSHSSPGHGVAQRHSYHTTAPRGAQQHSPSICIPPILGTHTACNTELISNLATELHFLLGAITARHSSQLTVLCVVLTLLIVFSDSLKWLVVFSPQIRQACLNGTSLDTALKQWGSSSTQCHSTCGQVVAVGAVRACQVTNGPYWKNRYEEEQQKVFCCANMQLSKTSGKWGCVRHQTIFCTKLVSSRNPHKELDLFLLCEKTWIKTQISADPGA